jgi:hemoglobin
MAEPTIFDAAGGAAVFERLVQRFYERVAGDPVLRPMYPDDLEPPARHLTLFLIQYFGGPNSYSMERGHPRLRMRHLPFAINQQARDRWIEHMTAAVESLEIEQSIKQELLRYFEDAATFLINQESTTD